MVLSGREKATIFLSILGAETASRVLRYLPDELADLIAAGINHLPTPSTEALSEVMDEFQSFLALPSESSGVIPQVEEKKFTPPPPAPKKSYSVLIYERPQMIAFILSLLPENEREEALLCFQRDKSVIQEMIQRLRRNPLTAKLENKLKEQFRDKVFI
jgi:flagellar motor switch protein FliG